MTILIQFYGRIRMTAFKGLMVILINPTALGHPIRFPYSFLCRKRKGMLLGHSLKNMGVSTDPWYTNYCQLWLWHGPNGSKTPLALKPLLLLPSCHRNTHHTQHLLVSHLTSYEILFLTAFHITLSYYNYLNLATPLPLRLVKHLMIPHDYLQETPLGTADFSWFIDGSHLKN